MPNIEKETHFVMRNGKAEYPSVAQENLLAWYDAKGKHNPDRHKDTLLDLSGNNRHAQLYNFAYEKKSGYLDNPEGGLLFDDVDDKLVYPSVKDEVAYTSASRNQLPPFSSGLWTLSGGATISGNTLTIPREGAFATIDMPWDRSDTKIRVSALYSAPPLVNIRYLDNEGNQIGTNGWANASVVPTDRAYGVLPYNESQADLTKTKTIRVSLTTGSATPPPYTVIDMMITANSHGNIPYTPYVPLPIMTYQYNGNILSYEADGTVKRVDDGKVITRKGINLVRNGNAYKGTSGFGQHQAINLRSSDYGVSATGDGTSSSASIVSTSFAIEGEQLYKAGDVFYMSGEVAIWSAGDAEEIGDVQIQFRTNRGLRAGNRITLPELGVWHKMSGIFEIGEQDLGFTNPYIRIQTSQYKNPINKNIELSVNNFQLINLTEAYSIGNEPTLDYIQAHPEEFAWTPNPNDLIEAHEIKNNLVGDLEDLHGTGDKTEILSGVGEVFTDKADDDSIVHVEIDGKSYQHAGSGKNLSPVNTFTKALNSAKSLQGVIAYNIPIDDTKEYRLSFESEQGWEVITAFTTNEKVDESIVKHNNMYIHAMGLGGKQTHSGSVISSGYKYLTITTSPWTLQSGYVGQNITIYDIQLEEGSTATEYEPPAPTPDYPIAIHSLNDFDVVSSIGSRNLLSESKLIRGIYLPEKNGAPLPAPTHSGTDFIKIDSNSYYTISANPRLSRESGNAFYFLRIVYYDSEKKYIKGSNNLIILPGENKHTTYSPSGSQYMRFSSTNETFPNVGSKETTWRLEKGTIATDWASAPEDITENDTHPLINKIKILLSEPLRSVGDVKDRLFRDSDGLWKVERNTSHFILESSTSNLGSWSGYNQESHSCFRVMRPEFSGVIGDPTIYSTHFKYQSNAWTIDSPVVSNSDAGNFPNIWFMVPNKIATNLNKLKTWADTEKAKGTPIEFVHPIPTPIIETLPQADQDKLNNIATYAGSNYVYTVLPDKDASLAEQLQPTIHAKFRKLSWFWSRLLFNQLKIWKRNLTDSELLHEWKQNKKRWGM